MESVFEESIKISHALDPSVAINLGKFSEYCKSANNEALKGLEGDDDDKTSPLNDLCLKHENDFKKIKERLAEAMIDAFSEDESENIKKYLSEDTANRDLIKDLSSEVRNDLIGLRNILHSEEEKKSVQERLLSKIFSGDPPATKGELVEKINTMLSDEERRGSSPSYESLENDLKKEANKDKKISLEDLEKLLGAIPSTRDIFNGKSASKVKQMIGALKNSENYNNVKEAPKKNLCKGHLHKAKFKALESCWDDDKMNKGCLNEKFQEEEIRPQFLSSEKKIAAVLQIEHALKGKQIGEEATGNCQAIPRKRLSD